MSESDDVITHLSQLNFSIFTKKLEELSGKNRPKDVHGKRRKNWIRLVRNLIRAQSIQTVIIFLYAAKAHTASSQHILKLSLQRWKEGLQRRRYIRHKWQHINDLVISVIHQNRLSEFREKVHNQRAYLTSRYLASLPEISNPNYCLFFNQINNNQIDEKEPEKETNFNQKLAFNQNLDDQRVLNNSHHSDSRHHYITLNDKEIEEREINIIENDDDKIEDENEIAENIESQNINQLEEEEEKESINVIDGINENEEEANNEVYENSEDDENNVIERNKYEKEDDNENYKNDETVNGQCNENEVNGEINDVVHVDETNKEIIRDKHIETNKNEDDIPNENVCECESKHNSDQREPASPLRLNSPPKEDVIKTKTREANLNLDSRTKSNSKTIIQKSFDFQFSFDQVKKSIPAPIKDFFSRYDCSTFFVAFLVMITTIFLTYIFKSFIFWANGTFARYREFEYNMTLPVYDPNYDVNVFLNYSEILPPESEIDVIELLKAMSKELKDVKERQTELIDEVLQMRMYNQE